ncbi:MAG: hypothetical protein LBU51_09930 [Bacteroidales bacterium]|jgi:hypothetical protein|nr:hypothetical protein [Bacteroidales bacterium]
MNKTYEQTKMRKYLFWGILFIAMGILWILNKTIPLHISFRDVLYLWPFILIWTGIGFLPIKDTYKICIDIVTIVCFLFLLIHQDGRPHFRHHQNKEVKIYCDEDETETIHSSVAFNNDSSYAHLQLDAGAASILFAEGHDKLVDIAGTAKEKGNINISTSTIDNKSDISVKIKPKNGNIAANYTVFINPEPVWKIDIKLGATDNDIDLSNFKIQELTIEASASVIDLTIGELYPEVSLKIETGVSSIKITIPKSMDCRIENESALTSKNFEGFTKEEKGVYVSKSENTVKKGIINIEMSSGVSDITVIRH